MVVFRGAFLPPILNTNPYSHCFVLSINRNKEMGEKNKSEIDRMMAMVNALEQKSVEAENDISELKSDTEALRMNLTLSNSR